MYLFYVILIDIGLYFFCKKKYKSDIKYLAFIKTLKTYKKNVFFCAYSLSKLKKKSYCIFIQNRKLQKYIYYILACILALITSLLKS
jgi:hypothetical protein